MTLFICPFMGLLNQIFTISLLHKVQLKIPITTKESSALVAHLGRVPRIKSKAVGLILSSIPSPDLCERNTFGGVQQSYELIELVSSMD